MECGANTTNKFFLARAQSGGENTYDLFASNMLLDPLSDRSAIQINDFVNEVSDGLVTCLWCRSVQAKRPVIFC